MNEFRLLMVSACMLAVVLWPAESLAESRAPFERLYRQAYATRLQDLGPDHPTTVASLVRLAALLRSHGRAEDAEPLLRAALAAGGDADSADESVLIELAAVLEALGRGFEAEDLYVRWLDIGETGGRSAKALLRIAALRAARGDADGARQAYRHALEHFDADGRLGEAGRKARAAALNDLGLLLEASGSPSEAETAFRRAAEAHAEEFGDEHPATAATRANLAGMLALRGEASAAAAHLERARTVLEAAFGARHEDVANVRSRLGEIYEAQGRLEAAEAEYLAALAALQEPSPSRGIVLTDLGRLAGVKGDFASAEALLREAVEILPSSRVGATAQLAEALDSYGSVLRAQHRLDAAEGALRKALTLREQALGASHPDVALTLVGLAGVLHLRGDLAAAEPLYRRALGIQEQVLGPMHPDLGETLYNLAHLEAALGDVSAAREGFERSAAILTEAYGPDDPFVTDIRAALRALR